MSQPWRETSGPDNYIPRTPMSNLPPGQMTATIGPNWLQIQTDVARIAAALESIAASLASPGEPTKEGKPSEG